MTIWICGTSVSIARDGYVGRLQERLGPQTCIENISVGDQTSIFGLIRVMQTLDRIAAGDVLVWEYPLLDILLESMFGLDDIDHAMQQAWAMASARGAHLVVVKVVPREYYPARCMMEQKIDETTARLGIPLVCTRRIAAELGIAEPAAVYADDRHPHAHSPLLAALGEKLAHLVLDRHGRAALALNLRLKTIWRWIGSETLEVQAAPKVARKNSFIAVDAIRLDPDLSRVVVPTHRRIVAVAIASTHYSGSLWCGHQYCLPASLRLPADLSFDFLVRGTRIPCARGTITMLVAAPPHAFPQGGWADYGQAACVDSRAVEVLGVLLEEEEGVFFSEGKKKKTFVSLVAALLKLAS